MSPVPTTGPRVAIIGSGLSGLAMGSALKRAGMEDFTIFEKAAEVGGTWRENTYPGLTCDVPGRFYQFRNRPNPEWSHLFAPGSEIQQYIQRYATEEGLRPHIRFGQEVTDAAWQDGRWRLRTADGAEDTADVVVTATGVLHHPKMPDIGGMASFDGPSFHSARWDHAVELAGKRVAVVGTGSTSCQIVGALAGVASHVDVYQRSRHWVIEAPNPKYHAWTKALLRRWPKLSLIGYYGLRGTLFDWFAQAPVVPGPRRKLIQAFVRAQFRLHVRDKALRERITPDHEPFCTRLITAPNYLSAIQRPDVDVITEGIGRIEPAGPRTKDGALHPADVIVYATGFDAHAFMRPMAIAGKDGLTLDEAWVNGPQAYRSVALPGFPNLFTLQGPHSPVGNYSLLAIAETQVGYIMQWLERIRAGEVAWATPRQDVTDAYYREMEQNFPNTAWAGGCQSWYHDANGKIGIWAWTIQRHKQMLARIEPQDFEIHRPATASAAVPDLVG